MEYVMDDDANWERLAKVFFARPAAPRAVETEAFVARVMSRLPAEDPGLLARLTGRWLAPALGLGLAALAFSFAPYARDAGFEPAAALLAARADRAGLSEWLARPGAPAADDLYALNSEER